MQSLTWDEVRARRLSRHFLQRPAPREKVADVVRAVCGIHAQVMASAELSLGLRVNGLTKQELATELWERRRLVKTYGLRGTVHLLPSDELALWVAAFQANSRRNDARRLEYLGLTQKQLNDMIAATVEALDRATRPLSRDELGAEVIRRVGSRIAARTVSAFGGQWPIWMSAIGAAAHAGALCFGPSEGTRVTFERPGRWIGAQPRIGGAEALREVYRRYLAAYGPATHTEFAQWFTMPASHAREVAQSLGTAVEEVDVEGSRALQLADDSSARARRARSVILLPRFDPYVVGSHPRDELVPPSSAKRALATGILPKRARTGRESLVGPMPVLLLDGQVAGVWEQRRARGRIAIRVQAFVRLTADDRHALEGQAGRIGAVLGEEAALSFGAITTRPHL